MPGRSRSPFDVEYDIGMESGFRETQEPKDSHIGCLLE
jgi:hypothetical protein